MKLRTLTKISHFFLQTLLCVNIVIADSDNQPPNDIVAIDLVNLQIQDALQNNQDLVVDLSQNEILNDPLVENFAKDPEMKFITQRIELKEYYKSLFLQNNAFMENPEEYYNLNIDYYRDLKSQINDVYLNRVKTSNSQNVHCFDPLVSGTLSRFLNFAYSFGFGKAIPSNEAIELAEKTENFPTKWSDGKGNFHDVLRPVCAGFGHQDSELFSRSITFAIELYQFNGYEFGYSLMNANRDNYELAGGCLPGRRNRIFLAFVEMMDFLLEY